MKPTWYIVSNILCSFALALLNTDSSLHFSCTLACLPLSIYDRRAASIFSANLFNASLVSAIGQQHLEPTFTSNTTTTIQLSIQSFLKSSRAFSLNCASKCVCACATGGRHVMDSQTH